MDDIVKAAVAKWPKVPDCYGWLGLDARGNWYLRDEQAQAAGPFAGRALGAAPGVHTDPARQLAAKGSLLQHHKLIEFIQRNYEADRAGQWFFQNGPQRVYVELEATPWVWRLGAQDTLDASPEVRAHSGQLATVRGCWVDEAGKLYLETDLGFGLVHTQDMLAAAEAIEQRLWAPQTALASSLPQRFGYITSPQSLQKP